MSSAFEAWLRDENPLSVPCTQMKIQIQAQFNPAGRTAEVIIQEVGWLNGRYFSEATLLEAIPLFEGLQVTTYGYSNRGLSEGSYRDFTPGFSANIIGVLENVRPGKSSQGRFALVATLQCSDVNTQNLLSASARVLKTSGVFPLHIKFDSSGIVARGSAEGRSGFIVSKITRIFEAVLVDRAATEPGGGQITSIMEAR